MMRYVHSEQSSYTILLNIKESIGGIPEMTTLRNLLVVFQFAGFALQWSKSLCVGSRPESNSGSCINSEDTTPGIEVSVGMGCT